MKRTQSLVQLVVLATLVVGLSGPSPAQERGLARKDVPQAVLAAFAQTYPKATIRGYFQEVDTGQTVYEIESLEGKTTRHVLYSADGKLILVEESVNTSELPAGVKAALDKKFPGGKILTSEKVTKGAVVGYEFQVEHGGRTAEIVFDPKGDELTL